MLLWWATGLSVALSVGGVFLARWLVVAMPADYFVRRLPPAWEREHPVIRWSLVIGKNLLGGVLAVAGAAMLVAPGPGVLTILAGLVLLDIPGKRMLEQRFMALPKVLSTINHMRARANRPPLEMPQH